MLNAFTIDPPPAGSAAYIIANGPSLRGVDLAALPARASFGMNAAYRDWDRIGWYPAHYACVDEVVGLHHADAIAAMIADTSGRKPRKFLLRRNLIEQLGSRQGMDKVVDFDAIACGSRALARQPVTTGSHSLIWAITLGYGTSFILGADCNYVEIVEGADRRPGHTLEIVRDAPNPNYYFDDYQQLGDRYNVPNIGGETHLRSWRAAAAVAAEEGAQVYNLSYESRIDAFDFASLDQVLVGGKIEITPRETRARQRRPPALSQPARRSLGLVVAP